MTNPFNNSTSEPDEPKAHALLWQHLVALMAASSWDRIYSDYHAAVGCSCVRLSELPKLPKLEMGELVGPYQDVTNYLTYTQPDTFSAITAYLDVAITMLARKKVDEYSLVGSGPVLEILCQIDKGMTEVECSSAFHEAARVAPVVGAAP